MSKWNMIVDVERCENCYNCFLATKDEHVGNDFPGYAAPQPEHGHQWIKMETSERGQAPMVEANFMPTMCNHCDDAPCMKAARDGAISKRPDGIVIIDPVKAKGQRQIVDACPYSAIYWNEELEIPQAWIFDAHLLDKGWKRTRAEQVCPTGALRSVKTDDKSMEKMVADENLAVLRPELNTRPRVYYKNLHLMNSYFIGGTVVSADTDDVAIGVEVKLYQGENLLCSSNTDAFGDFKFDGISKNDSDYLIKINDNGRKFDKYISVNESIYLGICYIT